MGSNVKAFEQIKAPPYLNSTESVLELPSKCQWVWMMASHSQAFKNESSRRLIQLYALILISINTLLNITHP